MKKLIFFSNNKNKISEVANIFSESVLNILNTNMFKKINSPEEVGTNFKENAKIKSLYGFREFNLPCFADDSGICIEALNNKPGIKSKDFIEKNGGLSSAYKKILIIVKEKKNYSAFFQTTISLTINEKKTIFFEGILQGQISKKEIGLNGFGYDPIFIPTNHSKTLAEMTTHQKNLISHRAIALNKLKKYLTSLV